MPNGNKSKAAQALLSATSSRDADMLKELAEFNRKQRAEVILNGGSCLTCKHTKAQRGIYLFCSLKSKKVNQYSFCEKWKSLVSKKSEGN